MRNLIQFFLKYIGFILFLVLEIECFVLYLKHHHYPNSVIFSSTNVVTSGVMNVSNEVKQFVNLRSANSFLSSENARLNNRVAALEQELTRLSRSEGDSTFFTYPASSPIRFLSARVVNASSNRVRNYLTLDRGSDDGVREDMGVVSGNQVVGIVKSVSRHFCVVLPLIHPSTGVSCKLRSNGYVGVLRWEPGDDSVGLLADVGRHVSVTRGDSVVTSGYTSVFPEGFYVGRVLDCELPTGATYYTIQVGLGVNYKTLSHVEIVDNKYYEEQRALEEMLEEE
ncbi:MAG: rod shape-determining protein MreC [Paludibacteraceae bacterium]|nr:rod shape-determining protein MreC [Paludibacteraceae bacterium]